MHKQEQVQEQEHRAAEQGQWVLAQTKHHKVQVHQHNKAEEAIQTAQLPKPEPVHRVQLMALRQPPPEAGAHHQVAKAGHEEVQQVEPHQADQPQVPEQALVQTQRLQAAAHQVHRQAAAEHQPHHPAGNNNGLSCTSAVGLFLRHFSYLIQSNIRKASAEISKS
jgi:hypothetical protein